MPVSSELALLLLTERARYFSAFNFSTLAMYFNVFICFLTIAKFPESSSVLFIVRKKITLLLSELKNG